MRSGTGQAVTFDEGKLRLSGFLVPGYPAACATPYDNLPYHE